MGSEGAPAVSDWATDFDLFDRASVTDPAPIWRDLRERCPVARTERRGTTWLPVDYGDVRAVAQDTDHFSSRDVGVVTARRAGGRAPEGPPPPADHVGPADAHLGPAPAPHPLRTDRHRDDDADH